jgi:integrase
MFSEVARSYVGAIKASGGQMSTVERATTETGQKQQKRRLQVVSEETLQVVKQQKPKSTGQTRRSNGTLSEIRPGVWKLRVTVGYRESGSPIQKARIFRGISKREAERALAAFVTEVGAPRRGEGAASRTVANYLTEWIEHFCHPDQGHSPLTGQVYRRTVTGHLIPHIGHIRLDLVATEDIDTMVTGLRAQGLGAGTQHRILTVVSSAMTHAVRSRLIPTNPVRAAVKPSYQTTLPPIPTPEEVQKMIALAYENGDQQMGDAISLIAATGMRRSEACALRFSDWNPERGVVSIARSMMELNGGRKEGRTKTPRSRRTISLDAQCVEIITRRQKSAGPTDFILGTGQKSLAPVRVTHVYHRMADTLGIKATRVHSLRHFNATQLLAHGVPLPDVAGRLGDDPKTILSNYAGVIAGADQKAADLMGTILGGTKADT